MDMYEKLHKSLLSISNSRIIVSEHFRWKYILFGNRYLSVSLLVPRRNRKILGDDSTECSNRVPGFKHEASFPLSSKNSVEQRTKRSAPSLPFFSFIRESGRAHTHTHTHTHTRMLIYDENKRQKNEAACRFSESRPYLRDNAVWLGEHSRDMSP